MLNNKKYIIFDWNGTLIDDAHVFVDVLNVLLKRRRLGVINLHRYRELFCFPIKDFYKKIGLDVSDKAFAQLKIEFVNEYNKRQYEAKLFIRTQSMLQKLQNNKLLFVLSASNQNTLNKLIKYYGIQRYFQHIIGVDNYIADGKIEQGKKLIKKINGSIHEMVLVGDTDHDYEVATNLGIDCILISHGHQSRARLNNLNSQVIENLDQLLE